MCVQESYHHTWSAKWRSSETTMSTILVWSGGGHALLQVCFWWDYHKEKEESGMLLAGILKFSQLLLLFVHSTHNAAWSLALGLWLIMRGGTEPSTIHAKIRTLALLLVLNMLLARCRRRRLFIIIRYRRLIGDILHLKLILLFLQLILTINCAKRK